MRFSWSFLISKILGIKELFSLKMCIRSAKNMNFVCLYALFSFMLCFHVCTHICFNLTSSVHIIRTFQNRIPFQTVEKRHNVSYHYVSYIKSETSNIWRTGAWFWKWFRERVKENHIYHLVKLNSTVRTRTVYRGCNVCYQVFLKNGKNEYRRKIWSFNINF